MSDAEAMRNKDSPKVRRQTKRFDLASLHELVPVGDKVERNLPSESVEHDSGGGK